jgi:hypothetical protein
MKAFFVKSMLVIALPSILAVAFLQALYREIKSAFWYAWQEVRIECASFRKLYKEPLQ